MIGILRAKNILISILLIFTTYDSFCQLSQYSRSDPYPMYTALDPHTFLYRRTLEQMKGNDTVYNDREFFGLQVSVFGQTAKCGRSACYCGCTPCCCSTADNQTFPPCGNFQPFCCDAALGDLEFGTWAMIPTLFGPFPCGYSNYPSTTLQIAQQHLFPTPQFTPGAINDPQVLGLNGTFPNQSLGIVTFPLTYKKWGFRTELDFQVSTAFGFMLQTGVATICQTGTFTFCNPGSACCTDSSSNIKGDDSNNNVQTYLVCQTEKIAQELCYDLRQFSETGMEDIRLIGYWRRAYWVNKGREGWPEFLAIPFLTFGGSFATGKAKCPTKVFGVPFGSNGHNSIGASTGIDLDFVQTIEIGGEVGLTHFFKRQVCNFPLPTNEYQSGIFPFKTDVTISPGFNWHFGLKMLAYRFLDRLSGYFEWIIVTHQDDCIRPKKCDPAFKPQVIAKRSCWQSQLGNFSLYYDISPCLTIGVLWQMPLAEKGAYRASTVLFSFSALF